MHLRLVVIGLVALAIAGCQDTPFQLAPVSGKATLDGEPLAGGVINFQPQASSNSAVPGPGSSARIDQQGNYMMETIKGQSGAVVGTHKVKVYSYSPETPVASDSDTGPRKERVPERYNYRTTLTFEVPPGGTEQADFELTTNPPDSGS